MMCMTRHRKTCFQCRSNEWTAETMHAFCFVLERQAVIVRCNQVKFLLIKPFAPELPVTARVQQPPNSLNRL